MRRQTRSLPAVPFSDWCSECHSVTGAVTSHIANANRLTAQIVANIINFWKQGIPIRLGVQLVPHSLLSRATMAVRDGHQLRPLIWDDTDISERVTRAFHMLHNVRAVTCACCCTQASYALCLV
jgi:hypothetical protein